MLVGGKSQRRGGSVQHIIFGCAQVIRQCAPGIAAEICAVHDLIVSRGIPRASIDGLEPNRLDGQGVTPIKRFQRRGGIVGNTGEVVADKLPRHDLHIAGFLDGNVGRQALIGHACLDDLTGVLDLHLNGRLIQPVKFRRLGFYDFVPCQRQGFAHRQAVFVRLDRIHQTVRAGVVNFKDGVGDGRPGRPAVHGVVVRTDLRHLDLAGDGGVLPLDFRGFAGFYIHGLFLRVGDIALIFQFPQIIAAIFQSLKADIAPVIAGFLRDGIAAAVIEEEGHAGDALAGDGIDLVDQNAGDGLVGDLQRGGLPIPDLDPMGRVIQTVAIGSFQLRHGVPAVFRFGEIDHAVFISGEGADDLAIHFPNLKLDAGDAFSGFFVLFNDGKPARADVIKAQGLHLTRLDENGFRGTIQHKAIHGLDLPRRNGGAGDQIMDNDAAILIGDELSVASAHNSAAAVGHKEGHALQRRCGALDILFNHKGGAGRVGEVQRLGVIGIDYHRLGAAGLVDGVAGNGGRFRHHQRPHHTMDGDFAVLVGEVQAVAADLSVFSGYKLTGRGRHLEGHALQGLPGEGVPLVDHQGSGLGVFHDDRLRIAVFADDHVCGRTIHHIPCWGLELVDDISAGGQIDDRDLAMPIRGKDAVLRQGAGADHAVQPHLAASGSGHPELRAGKGLTGGAVPLLDDELTLGLVLEGQADRAALLDLNGLRLGVDQITVWRACFCYDDALAGFQAGDADLAMLIRPEDAVAVPNQRTVRIGDLKFRVGKGHAGVHGTDLADQQNAVRGVVKADGDHALLTAVRQIDRFRCVDDGVPIGRVNLLHDIGARG